MQIIRFKTIITAALIVICPAMAAARSNKNADAVITLRDGTPCFSYPKDREVVKENYLFSYISVSQISPFGGDLWERGIVSIDRTGLQLPDSKETCIAYGENRPGTKAFSASSKPLRFDIPYEVFIRVSTQKGVYSERKYSSDFCLTRNEKGETILVNSKAYRSECLKPGQHHKRNLWEKVFGK